MFGYAITTIDFEWSDVVKLILSKHAVCCEINTRLCLYKNQGKTAHNTQKWWDPVPDFVRGSFSALDFRFCFYGWIHPAKVS
jgi:hypothetical protein